MHETAIFILTGIVLLTFLCQWLAWWVKLPSILFLLLTGIVVGPGLHLFNPKHLFGDMLTPIIEIAVAIILFEGSLTLQFKEIKQNVRVIRRLLTLGVAITAISSSLLCHWLFHFGFKISVLLGVIISVSGPTVIVPILRTVRPNEQISNILRWEGIIVDPIGALLAVLVYNLILALHLQSSLGKVTLQFLFHTSIGALLGIVVGYLTGLALRRHWFPDFLQNIATLALVLLAYGVGNHFDSGSGLLAVTIMGITLSNMEDVHIEDILDFKESLSLILISSLFIILAAQIQLSHLFQVLWSSILLILLLQFIVRPVSVFLCTLGSQLRWQEKCMLSWIYPRGIVAAAVSALFAIRLQQNSLIDSDDIVLVTFLVIIGTVIFQSLTSAWVARLLKVNEPESRGYLIVGANALARTIGAQLMKLNYRVLLTTTTWENAQAARMEGLPVFYGNLVSEYADRHLDLVGVGKLLALSGQSNLNTLAALRYKREFGAANIYSVQTSTGESTPEEKQVSAKRYRGKLLFEQGLSFGQLMASISIESKITQTMLSPEFTFEMFKQQKPNANILFALDPKNRIHFPTVNQDIKPDKDWIIVSLNPADVA